MNISHCRALLLSSCYSCASIILITDRLSRAYGGVAERLIAPVLKTGRPKGLVSSNLTPSAGNLRFSIADFRFVSEHRQNNTQCPTADPSRPPAFATKFSQKGG